MPNRAALLKCNTLCKARRPLLTLRCPEEVLQFLESFLGTFFLEEMAAIETAPGNRRARFRPPGREDVPQLPYGVFCPPKGVNRCHDLVARVVIRFVHLKADICRRSKILAPAMNRRRAAEAAAILAQCFTRDGSRCLVQPAKHYFQIVLRVEPNEMFWQGRRLDKEEPPHVLRRKLLVGLSIHRQCRSDIHETNLFDAFGKVETQPMGDTGTPIVGTHKELLVPKMTHRLDLVQRHCAERVIDVAISVARAARIPVSSQIRYVDRKPLGESWRDFMPGNMGLGISMQKEHRWSVAFMKNRDDRSTGANLSLHKAGKKLRRDILRRLWRQFRQRYGFRGDSLRRLRLVGIGNCPH
jgi:hypothetical protein